MHPHDAAIARIARALQGRVPALAERDEPFKEAAVALVLRHNAAVDDLDLLLIRRAQRAGDPWSGQIGLPGGRFEPNDSSLEETAVRETIEELGLDVRQHGVILGALDELRPRTPVLPPIIVRPYVCVVRDVPTLVPSDEVSEYRWVRVGELFHPDARVNTTVRVRDYSMRVDAFQLGDFTVWGMTERILSTFAEIWR
jgi:8-oxo-dGTP pyrophosphatase MutT (NUDIX family)